MQDIFRGQRMQPRGACMTPVCILQRRCKLDTSWLKMSCMSSQTLSIEAANGSQQTVSANSSASMMPALLAPAGRTYHLDLVCTFRRRQADDGLQPVVCQSLGCCRHSCDVHPDRLLVRHLLDSGPQHLACMQALSLHACLSFGARRWQSWHGHWPSCVATTAAKPEQVRLVLDLASATMKRDCSAWLWLATSCERWTQPLYKCASFCS